jgi:hypothetical protein
MSEVTEETRHILNWICCGKDANLQLYCTCRAPHNWEFMIGHDCCGKWLNNVCVVVVAPQGADDLMKINICRKIATSRSRGGQLVYLGIS